MAPKQDLESTRQYKQFIAIRNLLLLWSTQTGHTFCTRVEEPLTILKNLEEFVWVSISLVWYSVQ